MHSGFKPPPQITSTPNSLLHLRHEMHGKYSAKLQYIRDKNSRFSKYWIPITSVQTKELELLISYRYWAETIQYFVAT